MNDGVICFWEVAKNDWAAYQEGYAENDRMDEAAEQYFEENKEEVIEFLKTHGPLQKFLKDRKISVDYNDEDDLLWLWLEWYDEYPEFFKWYERE